MNDSATVHIIGSGAVGLSLAACLAAEGRPAVAVRSREADAVEGELRVVLQNGSERLSLSLKTIGLNKVRTIEGPVAICAKCHANTVIAKALCDKHFRGPLVLLQNGLGVERPFLDTLPGPLYRCVLYLTAQFLPDGALSFHSIAPAALGALRGGADAQSALITLLSTTRFPFRAEPSIERESWRKAIINSVFNSLCPLLETDNGVFSREEALRELAQAMLRECLTLCERLGIALEEEQLMEQLLQISRGSSGQLISTLQDLKAGRPTEIEYLNLALARIGSEQIPPIALPLTEALGKMVLAKAKLMGSLEKQNKSLRPTP